MYNTIVVGAGQAGLSIGYYLKKTGLDYLILDKNQEIGQVWRERYDSLILFTSKQYSSLPGSIVEGDSNSLPTKDEISFYLKRYAETFDLPVRLNTEVYQIHKNGDYFSISTNQREYKAKNVIIATGPFQHPKIPTFAKKLASEVLQLHSSEYKNPTQLVEGNVLVVGGGNSGAQIAAEVSKERTTYLSTGQSLKFMPLYIGKKSIFWWFDKLGILSASSTSFFGKKIQKQGDPIFGNELKQAIVEKNVRIVGRSFDARGNTVFFNGQDHLEIQNVIWATGFKPDYHFLSNIPEVINQNGAPLHKRGITNIEGLFFLGLPWQYRRGSALLQGIGYDANYLVEHLRQ
ncbi:NAD(P)/FAD-dependent oxidoreductase [Paucisalibacillus sp. EB02]|uniref:flavin-containing monooxygenase n=1 Tax=Paucisalibacillus sp. EB02 TaxID=1347087 RepID=UPI0004B3DBD8|nr:NAD(P)/FAD-dependent oxidoreductase [Paucisalibacillus sp. EB02]